MEQSENASEEQKGEGEGHLSSFESLRVFPVRFRLDWQLGRTVIIVLFHLGRRSGRADIVNYTFLEADTRRRFPNDWIMRLFLKNVVESFLDEANSVFFSKELSRGFLFNSLCPALGQARRTVAMFALDWLKTPRALSCLSIEEQETIRNKLRL